MSHLTRRQFLSLAAIVGSCGYYVIKQETRKKVVIIGGGASGVIAAKYIRKANSSIDVTLIEQNKHYYTCFMSNEVLSGMRTMQSIKYNYEHVSREYGINMLYNTAIAIDPIAKTVRLQNGDSIAYDRLIVSPGIDFKWKSLKPYDTNIIPHAWKAGTQTVILRQQLEAMKNGETAIITVPPKPFRCPTAPYERASQIAYYFKHHKPKSKVLILDANATFSKQALFFEAWQKLYGYGTDKSIIEWHNVGTVQAVNIEKKRVTMGDFEDEYTGAVLNIIPPQTAGKIAIESGLTDNSGWCPIHPKTFESRLHKEIHVIGDACMAHPMPKSAHSANSQAKICAEAVISALQEKEMAKPSYNNTCYSIAGKEFAMSVTTIYHVNNEKIQVYKNATGQSPLNASVEYRKSEVAYAYSWYNNITQDMFNSTP